MRRLTCSRGLAPAARPRFERESGQTLIEFMLCLLYLVLTFFAVFQMALIVIEKFRLNRDALYIARSWSVNGDEKPKDTRDSIRNFMFLKMAADRLLGTPVSAIDEWRWRCMSVVPRPNADADDGAQEKSAVYWYARDSNYQGWYQGLVFKYHIPVTLPGIRTMIHDPAPYHISNPSDHAVPAILDYPVLSGGFSGSGPGGVKTWEDVLGTHYSIMATTFIPVRKFPVQHPDTEFEDPDDSSKKYKIYDNDRAL